MSRVYSSSDPQYLVEMTAPEMRFTGQATREAMPGWDLGSIVLGDVADPDAAVISILRIAPNDTLPRHAHDCKRVEIILQGSITLPNGRELTSGDVMVSEPGEFYGPHVAGPEGCLSAEIFSAAAGLLPISDPDESPDSEAAKTTARVREVVERLQAEQEGAT